MINRMAGAALRALCVAFIVALPAMAVPAIDADVSQMVALLAIVAGGLTFVEYLSVSPSVIEFRSAPPFNRLRFVALALIVVALTVMLRHAAQPSLLGSALCSVATLVGQATDVPFSPVRLILIGLPESAAPADVALARGAAGIAYVISMLSLVLFVLLVRGLNWPVRRRAFNVWINLPLFDPTAGGDVLYRMKRDAHVNVALGFLLPFLIPAAMSSAASFGIQVPVGGPLSLIWVVTAWAFLPASMMMRGVALLRIADLIEEKRRRAYAQSADERLQVA